MDLLEAKNIIIADVAKASGVMAVGQTSPLTEIPIPGQSDIDLFVLCSKIPSYEERNMIYRKHEALCDDFHMEVCNGGVWGVGDILEVGGVDTMFMYFTIDEMTSYLKELLAGKHLEKEGGFYPIGRLATIHDMNIVCEKDRTFTKLKEMVAEYPNQLAVDNFRFHQWSILDEEDLSRSAQRKDILFYHMVLESAMDHFLQALFALNYTYFPSRKKTKRYLEQFQAIPTDCYERLIQITKDSVCEETIERSIEELKKLANELIDLAEKEWHEVSE